MYKLFYTEMLGLTLHNNNFNYIILVRNLKQIFEIGWKVQAKTVQYHLIEKDQSFLLLTLKVLGGNPSLQLAANSML